MNKRQWKKQGEELKHNGNYAKYVFLFLKDKDVISNKTVRLDKHWKK